MSTIAGSVQASDDELGPSYEPEDSALEIDGLYAPYIHAFLRVLEQFAADGEASVPVIRGFENWLGSPLTVDIWNPEAIRTILLLLAGSRDGGPDFLGRSEVLDPAFRGRTARRAPFLDLRSTHDAARDFFSLFTASYWKGRLSRARHGSSHIKFTVFCRNSGYQLRCHPQFFYSPVVWGGNLTTPVRGLLALNDYHFQGALGTSIICDFGLYPVNSASTRATLTAF